MHCIGISADPIQWRLIVGHTEKETANMDIFLMDKILCTEWDMNHPEYVQEQELSRFVSQSLLGFPDGLLDVWQPWK